jgi:hypothetical protein
MFEPHKASAGQSTPDPVPIYRYLPAEAAEKTIKAGAFRVGRYRDFNDPFESRFGAKGIDEETANQLMDSFLSDVNKDAKGVLCFSATITNPVLWSLYADKHTGVAFELVHAWPADHLHKMSYDQPRPIIDFNHLRSLGDIDSVNSYLWPIVQRLMRQKSSGWSFEDEYRLFIDLNDSTRSYSTDGHYYWRIAPQILKRVILGFRCPLEENNIQSILTKNGFTQTRVVRTKMCLESYSIKC